MPGLEKMKIRGRGRAGIELFLLPGPGGDLNFFIAGAGTGPGLKKFYCRGRAGIVIFFIAGARPGF